MSNHRVVLLVIVLGVASCVQASAQNASGCMKCVPGPNGSASYPVKPEQRAADTITPEQRAACTPDARRYCAAYVGDEPALRACMATHFAQLSRQCREAVR